MAHLIRETQQPRKPTDPEARTDPLMEKAERYVLDNVSKECVRYWTRGLGNHRKAAHWKGYGRQDETWYRIGDYHMEIYSEMAQKYDAPPVRSILEWGCGGGSNVVAFGVLAEEIFCVDISHLSLTECERQTLEHHPDLKLHKILIRPDMPEDAMGRGQSDFFLCTAVLQHMLSPRIIVRTLEVAKTLTMKGSYGLVQYRQTPKTKARMCNYALHVSRFVTLTYRTFCDIVKFSGWEVVEVLGGKQKTKSGYKYAWIRNV